MPVKQTWEGTLKHITELMEHRDDRSDRAPTNEFSHQCCLNINPLNLWEGMRGQHTTFWTWPHLLLLKGLFQLLREHDNKSFKKRKNYKMIMSAFHRRKEERCQHLPGKFSYFISKVHQESHQTKT